jgi:hypothetical protein
MKEIGISFICTGIALIVIGNAGGYGLIGLGIFYIVNEKNKKKNKNG